ncbi:MAG TPA: MBL fold metallo-hydrolase, partial [Flavobacteriales bacterium]|nr:MBL fold metallo-hydrolase [Flavobacteriales bacterium]
MTLEFFGAAECVTGSKHLITLSDDTKILLDCGMFQGMGKETEPLNRHFGFDPSSIHALILSHAHIDHSGLIPRLIKEGFRGKIYCTDATFDLCKVMLKDSAKIQEYDIMYLNKKRKERKQKLLEPLYTEDDVNFCLQMFETRDFETPFDVTKNVKCVFTDNGHILGSAAVYLKINEEETITR